jgi:NACHT domain
MLRTPQWPLWIEGKQRCLWIHGIPGAGKSILASYVAEEIEKYCNSSSGKSSKLGHAYYYCYFGHNQDESSHFLRWIIGQLCRQSEKVPEKLQNIYKSGKTPTISSLLSVLHSTMEGFERVYLVLDAVDESMPRADLLRVIRDLSTDARFSALGLLVTSREYIDIEQVLEVCSIPISMSNSFVEEDIGTLVRSIVQSDVRYQRWPEDLRCEMKDTIPKKAKGM